MSTTTIVTIANDTVSDISTVLQATLPTLFALIGLLIGAFFVYRLIKKHIGRPR
jgi:hypothetical protein